MIRPHKRTQFYIRNSIQGKYILSCFLIACLVAILYSALLIFFSSDTVSLHYDQNGLTLADTPSVLMNIIWSIHGILVLVLGGLILFIVTRYTHRSAGPIQKINRILHRMAQGDISREIHLRKNDEHKDTAEILNQVNTALNEKITEIELLAQELDDCLNGGETGNAPEDQSKALTLAAINEQLKSCLSFFTTSREPKVEP